MCSVTALAQRCSFATIETSYLKFVQSLAMTLTKITLKQLSFSAPRWCQKKEEGQIAVHKETLLSNYSINKAIYRNTSPAKAN